MLRGRRPRKRRLPLSSYHLFPSMQPNKFGIGLRWRTSAQPMRHPGKNSRTASVTTWGRNSTKYARMID